MKGLEDWPDMLRRDEGEAEESLAVSVEWHVVPVCRAESEFLDLPVDRLAPMESTATNGDVGEDLPDGFPQAVLEVEDHLEDFWL